jgi:CHAT domain-containing protein
MKTTFTLRIVLVAAALGLGFAAGPLRAQAAVGAEDPAALRAEAFEAAQWAVRSEAAEALAKLSARFAKGGDAIAGLTNERDELMARRAQLERRLEQLYGSTGADAEPQRAQARRDYSAAQAALDELDRRIEAAFPAYADLINPKAVSLAQTQALLKPDEGLILFLVNPEATYVWAVTREKSTWARVDDLGEQPLADAVAKLRRQLNWKEVSGEKGAAHYDSALAYRLYDRLIRPVEGVLAGKTTLITVTSGPLSAFPLAALPTDPAGPGGDTVEGMRRLHWLVDRYALATLPSVSSLKTLRCDLVARASQAPGCPKATASQPAAAVARGVLLFGVGAPALNSDGVNAVERSSDTPAAALFDGAHADRAKLMALGELKGAKAELEALQAQFSGAIVRMSAEATETDLKTTDRETLSKARYVIFSTHGVLAGANVSADGAASLAEPGLVLTPPPVPSDLDDGYLSASEAAQLHLSADFVVLSACNTATSEGAGDGDGLSTLARSFFYAGGRSLLVSHWEIADEATSSLILKTFGALEASQGKGRASALRQAMVAVRGNPKFGHPYFWAPFSLVGEPDQ